MIEIAVGLGVAFSLVFHETFGLAAGGIVVPGYIALNFHNPEKLIGTLIVALVVWACIRIISQFVFVYGRRRMVIAVLLGFVFGYLSRQVFNFGIFDLRLEAIGFIIPGLIANWMERQGVYKTITTVLMGGAMVRLAVIVVTGGKLIQNV
ncbi:MAG: poly-gamma-glutamate biosynthesis protein PgsC [Calditrichaeota bacterium]|nr:poly-gamma-glutamate biosynthesis protein PgsC [Calditrichota bacterium]MBT7617415.1 poly-gamma-glutamate biosynthesis protein PgsC [Calditrichota bacterium]MBT7790404.1 poly-gamma-glutamate biosynthesis protein PgsC [Calditrichota bacterium]